MHYLYCILACISNIRLVCCKQNAISIHHALFKIPHIIEKCFSGKSIGTIACRQPDHRTETIGAIIFCLTHIVEIRNL